MIFRAVSRILGTLPYVLMDFLEDLARKDFAWIRQPEGTGAIQGMDDILTELKSSLQEQSIG
jgi:hypothetical protein